MKKIAKLFLLFSVLGLTLSGYSISAEEQVYGWQLMSEQERTEHRTKMQSFNTNEEREQYRLEHHKMMQERAKQQGVSLPEMPQQRGKGMERGPGAGTGGGGGR